MAEDKKIVRKSASKEAKPSEPASVKVKEPEFTAVKVKCDGFDALNVRETPGGVVLRAVKNGSKLYVGKESDGWRPVKDGGYVMAKYVG